MPVLTYAVVGNTSVGKSAFIRNALNLRRPVSSISASNVSVGGVSYRLQLLETPRESLSYRYGRISWPPVYESGEGPDIDGVLCLYDVSDKESLVGLPQVLAALSPTDLPVCLVSCKVDIPLCDHEVGPEFADKVKSKYPQVFCDEVSYDHSESAKRCLIKILTESLRSNKQSSQLATRSKVVLDPPIHFSAKTSELDQSLPHSRNRSKPQPSSSKPREELPTAPPPVIDSADEDSDNLPTEKGGRRPMPPPKLPLRVNTDNIPPKSRIGQPQTPISTTEIAGTRMMSLSERQVPSVPATPESYIGAAMTRRGSVETTDSRVYRTFLDMDDESINEDSAEVDAVADSLRDRTTSNDSISEGVTFKELVERLLAMPASKGDQKFVPIFLCFYRAFATPLQLLIAIINRAVKTDADEMVAFTRVAEILRYLSILGQWTTYYPGDFADPRVREMAHAFVTTMEKTKNYAAAARQIANNLQTIVPDEDDDWCFNDGKRSVRSRSNTTSQKTAILSPPNDLRNRQRFEKDVRGGESSDSDDYVATPLSPRHSATTSSASSLTKVSQISNPTFNNFQKLEIAREQARKLRIVPQIAISKTQWHLFMSCSTEELAVEITRIDWTMYSSIRPRDFIRYAMASNSRRARIGQPDYINLMTKHFNHLALFVSGMILLRDKPKHRAKMLEKLMDLAWKVRQMNNYHALGAIVAALNSEEILRLVQTQELIPMEQRKQFLRLKILMGHQKSHAAYRMAWDNSSSERIPFLPRIQEDLTKAASANATFVGEKINWSKFEVMGETMIGVQRSQDQPYNFPDRTAKGYEIVRLILETRVLQVDEVCLI